MKVICNKLDKCQIMEDCPHSELHQHHIGCGRDKCNGTKEYTECIEIKDAIKDSAPESKTQATKRAIESLEIAISFGEFSVSMVELSDGTAKDILQLLESYLEDQK